MEPETQPPPVEAPAPPTTSLLSRLTNVFVAPGEVFDEVSASPHRTGNWLVPVLLSCLMGIVFSVVAFSQETIVHDLRAAQEKAVQDQVDAGKMSQAQADQAIQAMQRFMSPTVMMLFGSVASVFASFAWLFFLALCLWGVGLLVFKARFGYLKAAEVCGLAQMIGVLGALITMLLVLWKGNLQMTLGPALLIPEFDPSNKTHLLLAALNVMSLWEMAVLAIGLAKISGTSFLKSALWIFVPWVLFKLAVIFSGLGTRGT